jgi:hypothetical protein
VRRARALATRDDVARQRKREELRLEQGRDDEQQRHAGRGADVGVAADAAPNQAKTAAVNATDMRYAASSEPASARFASSARSHGTNAMKPSHHAPWA